MRCKTVRYAQSFLPATSICTASLFAAPGVKIVDDPRSGRFPEPIGASGQDDVLVGRIRGDVSLPPGQGVNMFIAGDQLLKGAATNAVQIAELLL